MQKAPSKDSDQTARMSEGTFPDVSALLMMGCDFPMLYQVVTVINWRLLTHDLLPRSGYTGSIVTCLIIVEKLGSRVGLG